jgi:hypothetical protein
MVETNVVYALCEVVGKLGPEIQISSSGLVELTPHGALTLGRQLILWAAEHDAEIMQQYAEI